MKRLTGFTLVEILVVLGIIGLLTAILLPVLARARETGRQGRCISNLVQIYVAVNQYKQDDNRYPESLAVLLPRGTSLIVAAGNRPSTLEVPRMYGDRALVNSLDVIKCPNDSSEGINGIPVSSYETDRTSNLSVWNYWGYSEKGTSKLLTGATTFPRAMLQYPSGNFNATANRVVKSLSNRFAPPQTVITHCRYHRRQSAGLGSPDDLYNTAKPVSNARDIVLRLDGSARSYDVSNWNTLDATDTSKWQRQDF